MLKASSILLLCFVAFISCSHPTIVKQQTIGGDEEDMVQSMCATKDGGFIIGGWSYSDSSGEKCSNNHGVIYSDFWVIKFGAEGNMQWQKTIGANGIEFLRAMAATDDGGCIIGGETTSDISGDKMEASRGGTDIWVVKLDSIGNIQWDKTIGGSGNDVCEAIVQTKDKSYVIGGASTSDISGDKSENCSGDFDIWVIKLDGSGKILWDKTLGGNSFEFCGGIEAASDGGVVVCGNTASDKLKGNKDGSSLADCWLVKLNGRGNLTWEKTYGGSGDEMFLGICKTNDNGFILTAFSNSNKSGDKSEDSKGGWDYWVVKTDSSGHKQWDKTIGGIGEENNPFQVKQTIDGGYIIAGISNSKISGDKTDSCRGDFDYWIVRLNNNGTLNWDKTIGGNKYDEVRGIKEIGKGHFVVAGFTRSSNSNDRTDTLRGKADFWIVYLNESKSVFSTR
jgi:hypothetical protein